MSLDLDPLIGKIRLKKEETEESNRSVYQNCTEKLRDESTIEDFNNELM